MSAGILTSIRPQHALRSLVPQASSGPELPAPARAHVSAKTLNQADDAPADADADADAASATLAMYAWTGP